MKLFFFILSYTSHDISDIEYHVVPTVVRSSYAHTHKVIVIGYIPNDPLSWFQLKVWVIGVLSFLGSVVLEHLACVFRPMGELDLARSLYRQLYVVVLYLDTWAFGVFGKVNVILTGKYMYTRYECVVVSAVPLCINRLSNL